MIADAVLLIQTANAAIGAVKELIGNGKDLADCGAQIGKYFDSKAQIQRNADRSGSTSEITMFFELEKLRQHEEELKQMMIYSGRAGLWQDWLRFQADQKRSRDAAKADLQRKKMARAKAVKDGLVIIFSVLAILSAVGAAGLMVYWLLIMKDK